MSQITAVGVFEDRDRARAAVEALRRAGFAEGEVGLVSPEPRTKDGEAPLPGDVPRGGGEAAAGAAIGATAGAVTGLGTALALATGLIPGVGPVVAAGALALLMGGTGAAAGSLLGGLLGMGVPQDEAERMQQDLSAGRTLVTARAGARYGEALAILNDHGATQRTIDVGPRS